MNFLILLSISQLCYALEPKLLWKKEFREKVSSAALAKESADVILIHGDRNRITLIDKGGKTCWQWQSDLKGFIGGRVSISEDGRHFVFYTDFRRETDAPIKPIIHFYERSEGEIWKKELPGYPTISPDGKFIYVTTGWEDAKGWLLDSKGNILWKRNVGQDMGRFSPDGNFIWDGFNFFDERGNIVSGISLHGYLTSLSENLEYIAYAQTSCGAEITEKTDEAVRKAVARYHGGVINKRGSTILEGRAGVSENGKIAVIYGSEKTKVYKIPEKILLYEYPIKKGIMIEHTAISYDGNIIVILGERSDKGANRNLFIIDISRNELYEGRAEKEGIISITKDGKYFLIDSDKGLYCYEIIN